MVVALALFCLAVVDANASSIDGNVLFEHCKDYDLSKSNWFGGACAGYVLGARDAFDETTKPFCVPEGPYGDIAEQSVETVKLYLRDHPETRHLSAPSLVAAALKEKFPCN
jgi:hypothetical protein